MQLTVTGKQLDLGEAFRHVETSLGAIPEKYFKTAIEAHVVLSREAHLNRAELAVLLFRNRSHGELNLVYRRADGNIGWIDPRLDPARPPAER